MGISPFNQEWIDILTGTDQNGRPIYASTKNVKLDFSPTTVAKYQQFSALHGASLTSCELLGVDSGSYTVYNNTNIYLEISSRPKFDAGNVSGYSLMIRGITPWLEMFQDIRLPKKSADLTASCLYDRALATNHQNLSQMASMCSRAYALARLSTEQWILEDAIQIACDAYGKELLDSLDQRGPCPRICLE